MNILADKDMRIFGLDWVILLWIICSLQIRCLKSEYGQFQHQKETLCSLINNAWYISAQINWTLCWCWLHCSEYIWTFFKKNYLQSKIKVTYQTINCFEIEENRSVVLVNSQRLGLQSLSGIKLSEFLGLTHVTIALAGFQLGIYARVYI